MRIDAMIHLEDQNIYDCDVNQGGDVAYIMGYQGRISVVVSNGELASWPSIGVPYVRHVRWAADNEVILWSFFDSINNGNSARLISTEKSKTVPFGLPKDIIFVEGKFLSCYGEDQYICSQEGQVESHLVAVFDNNENFLWGLQEFLIGENFIDPPIDFQAGCADNEGNAILVLYPSEGLWRITPDTKAVNRIAVPFSMSNVVAVSAYNDSLYFAIRNDAGFLFVSFNTTSHRVRELGAVPYMRLLNSSEGEYYPRKLIQIHGCSDGSMVISALHSVWQVRF